MEDKKRLKEIKAKIKKSTAINKAIIMGMLTVSTAVYTIENARTNWVYNTPYHFQITSGIIMLAAMVMLSLYAYKVEIKHLLKVYILQDKLFGSINKEDKELTSTLAANWRKKYTSFNILFKDINIARSVVNILLARQVLHKLKELQSGLRLDEKDYQQFYQSTQKKLDFILKSKKDNKELQDLYQTSCTLLKETSYSLE